MNYSVTKMELQKLKSLRNQNNTTTDQQQQRKKLTRIALQLIVSADKLFSEQKYKMATKPLIFAADTLLSIKTPNNTVNTLTTVCFDYIAHAAEKQEQKRNKMVELNEQHIHRKTSVEEVMKVNFSKEKGLFVFADDDKRTAPPHIKFYVTKLNSILFGYNSAKAQNSLFAMFRIYNLPIILILLLVCFLAILEFSSLISIDATSSFASLQNLPIIISSCLFLIPLLLVYFKQTQVHNFSFLQMKLGEQIEAINKDCESRRLNIKFQLGIVAGGKSDKEAGYALNIKFQNTMNPSMMPETKHNLLARSNN